MQLNTIIILLYASTGNLLPMMQGLNLGDCIPSFRWDRVLGARTFYRRVKEFEENQAK